MLARKNTNFFNCLPLVLLLLSLSGCQSFFLTSETTAPSKETNASNYYNLQLGLAYLEIGDMLQAKSNLFKAETKHPKDPLIKSAIAYFLELTGEHEKAKVYHLNALKIDPIVN